MSEYQYYEFLAIDRPLDARQQQELRALSTRASFGWFEDEVIVPDILGESHWASCRRFTPLGSSPTLQRRSAGTDVGTNSGCVPVWAGLKAARISRRRAGPG
ncbi:MAG: hypothetical protein ACYCO3_13910 [Mycobacteriales bacterium]